MHVGRVHAQRRTRNRAHPCRAPLRTRSCWIRSFHCETGRRTTTSSSRPPPPASRQTSRWKCETPLCECQKATGSQTPAQKSCDPPGARATPHGWRSEGSRAAQCNLANAKRGRRHKSKELHEKLEPKKAARYTTVELITNSVPRPSPFFFFINIDNNQRSYWVFDCVSSTTVIHGCACIILPGRPAGGLATTTSSMTVCGQPGQPAGGMTTLSLSIAHEG